MMLRRFDTALMRPPAPEPAADEALLRRVRVWCETGAFPRLTQRLAAAGIAPHAGLDGVARALDGSHELARLPRWRGLAWRLSIVLRENLPAHPGRAADPWDCGWWRTGPLAAALSFRPRRATLLLVRDTDPAVTETLLAALRSGSTTSAHPLRVLVVGETPTPGLPRI